MANIEKYCRIVLTTPSTPQEAEEQQSIEIHGMNPLECYGLGAFLKDQWMNHNAHQSVRTYKRIKPYNEFIIEVRIDEDSETGVQKMSLMYTSYGYGNDSIKLLDLSLTICHILQDGFKIHNAVEIRNGYF